jgi:glycosyltransferase involved in cell wall biosynthesis
VSTRPFLSVGMLVYNGERFIEKAVRSILAQTFEDFELLISDNASTDKTREICRDLAAKDHRIRYFRNATNMGAGWNTRRVYSLAIGRYYKQAAHDDFCEPRYFERAIDVLEAEPEAVLAYGKTRVVDQNGRFVEDYECEMRVESENPLARFADLLLIGHRCYPIFGVIRMETLRRIPMQGIFPHSDRIHLIELSLQGRFRELPERLFISTRHTGQSVWTMPERSLQKGFRLTRKPGTLPDIGWWDPSRKRSIAFPEWNALRQYAAIIRRSPLTIKQKAQAFGLLAQWSASYKMRLMGDLVIAADQLIYNVQTRKAYQLQQQRLPETESSMKDQVAISTSSRL